MAEISVIVPVYNCERYLERCIQSVLNQSFSDFELILVNDGSTDNSPVLCDMWKNRDSRIRVLHKKNGGTSSARNAGIDIAKGVFLAFLDNDDWYELSMLETLYILASENGVKLAICNAFHWIKEGVMIRWPSKHIVEKLTYEEALRKALFNEGVGQTIWTMLLHRSILEKVRFPKVYWEDTAVYYKFLYYARECVYTDAPLYNYDRRVEEAKSKQSVNSVYDALNTRGQYFFTKKYGPASLKEQVLDVYFWKLFNVLANCADMKKKPFLFYKALLWAKIDYLYFYYVPCNEQYKIQGKAILKGYRCFLKCREEKGFY